MPNALASAIRCPSLDIGLTFLTRCFSLFFFLHCSARIPDAMLLSIAAHLSEQVCGLRLRFISLPHTMQYRSFCRYGLLIHALYSLLILSLQTAQYSDLSAS